MPIRTVPLIENSTYRAPWWLSGPHAQTIIPALIRRSGKVTGRRERIETADGDFLDLDWNESNRTSRVAILSHGLEGSSADPAVQSMAAKLVRAGWNVVAWNFRGCSGEQNRLLRSYHSGATEDLACVIEHVRSRGGYSRIALIGFSLGGNLTLKYLGEYRDKALHAAVTFSVPCDLGSSSVRLAHPENRIYMRRFLKNLRKKIEGKIKMFPELLVDSGLNRMTSFKEFDEMYTAPLNGFRSAEDYWERASSRPYLDQIAIPTLLVNARNDPFLAPECFPETEARRSSSLYLEVPQEGGHLGFLIWRNGFRFWFESRALEFLEGVG